MNEISGTATVNGGTPVPADLTVEQEMIDVTLGVKTEPDIRWEYLDPFGHFHAWDKNGKLPTLVGKQEHRECNGCGDESCEGYDVTVYDCAICGAPVEPATIATTPLAREYAPGLVHWSVEVEQDVTEDRVSVRFDLHDRTWFGIAACGNQRVEGGSDGIRVWTTLYGVGPLGERQRPKART